MVLDCLESNRPNSQERSDKKRKIEGNSDHLEEEITWVESLIEKGKEKEDM